MPQAGAETLTFSTSLVDRVRRVIRARPDLGYVSPTEYVRDAIRRRLEQDEPSVVVEEQDDLTVKSGRAQGRRRP